MASAADPNIGGEPGVDNGDLCCQSATAFEASQAITCLWGVRALNMTAGLARSPLGRSWRSLFVPYFFCKSSSGPKSSALVLHVKTHTLATLIFAYKQCIIRILF